MAIVTVVAMLKVGAMEAALRANTEEHVAIQRFAINFRGTAHDRSIATRDVVLACSAMEAGSKLVGDAGASMEDIVAQIQRVSVLIGEISSSTHEQTTGIGQVSAAVTDLDHFTQQNAAVEQSAAAADSLKKQAAHLASVVGTFKLGRQDAIAMG